MGTWKCCFCTSLPAAQGLIYARMRRSHTHEQRTWWAAARRCSFCALSAQSMHAHGN